MTKILIVLSFFFSSALFSADEYQGGSSIPHKLLPGLVSFPSLIENPRYDLNIQIYKRDLKDPKEETRFLHFRQEGETPIIVTYKSEKIEVKQLKILYRNERYQVFLKGDFINAAAIKLSSKDGIRMFALKKNGQQKERAYKGMILFSPYKNQFNVINRIHISHYLEGVVPAEAPASWPLPALKAQAVAARTYALYHFLTAFKGRPYHVDDTTRYQVYLGLQKVDPRTNQAIFETKGEVLTYHKKIIIAFFQAYSGGMTTSAKIIFGRHDAPYCKGVQETFTKQQFKQELSPKAHWIIDWQEGPFSNEEILTRLKKNRATKKILQNWSQKGGLNIQEAELFSREKTVKNLLLTQGTSLEEELTFKQFKSGMRGTFKSYYYRISKTKKDLWLIKGSGWGHHVGMSQWGAYMMAKNNKDYKQILHHYYTNVEIERKY